MTYRNTRQTACRFFALSSALVALLATASASLAASTLYVKGRGFGHGVGLSQYGAYGYAKHGQDYRTILAHYYSGTSIEKLPGDETVRVLLQPNRSSITFSGADKAGDEKLDPGLTYKISRTTGAGVELTSIGRRVTSSDGTLSVSGPGPLTLKGSGKYRGQLEFRAGKDGGVNAVNAVGADDYVRGVVANESPASWPAEALKTQAVAARTYAIASKIDGNGFDLYDDTRSQVYKGVAGEDPRSDRAVTDTAGEILTYAGKPAITYFFSTSGGKTESVENGFAGSEPKPWLKSVDDPYDSESPRHAWTLKFTLGEAQAKLSGLVKGRLKAIDVKRRGDSPRVLKAEIVGSRGRTTVTGTQLASRLGLYDTWAYFDVVKAGEKPDFREVADDPAPETPAPAPVDSSGGAIAN